MAKNYWNKLMGDPVNASQYMASYGEGVGAKTRHELGSFINDGESVLDVGAGPAWNYLHFKQFGPDVRYKGTDYSSFMVEGVKSKWPEIYFELGDVRKVEESDESWDVVIMQDVLEHTNGYEKPVHEALRVARKRAIFTFWHLADSDTPHINDDGDDGWGAWYDKREWEKFLDSLDLHWLHHQFNYPEDKARDFYIIDKEMYGN